MSPPRRGRPPAKRGPKPGQGKRSGGQGGRRTGQAPPPKARGPKGLGGDQVEGRQAVRELLLAGRRKVREITFVNGLEDAPILLDIIDLADEAKVPLREVGKGKFDALARTDAPQGVVALAAPVPEVDLEELVDASAGPPFLLAFDGVTDPGNLGAALRTAEGAGVTGVVLPRHRAAHLSPTVAKAAAGAIEHLPMALVGGLPAALSRLKDLGVWVVGLDETAPTSLFDLTVGTEPVVLVLGSEGRGLSRLVRQRCDALVSIPLKGALGSLNVSAAAALACYEITRLRTKP